MALYFSSTFYLARWRWFVTFTPWPFWCPWSRPRYPVSEHWIAVYVAARSHVSEHTVLSSADVWPHTHTHIRTYMHACIHTYIHTYIRMYVHTYIHACMHTHLHNTCIHTYYTYMHACIRTHTYVHTFMHTCMHTYIHTNTYIHAYIHLCIHAYIHTFLKCTVCQQTVECETGQNQNITQAWMTSQI